MNLRRLGLCSLLLLSCSHENPNPPTDAAANLDAAHTAPAAHVDNTPPENLLLVMRGATLRGAIPLLFPGGGAAEVLEQLSRQVTPGIADHGDEIDPVSPFAVAGTITGEHESTLTFYVAWPLKPGMQISQDARNHNGWREVSDGLYEPTAADAGASADSQCWIARRQPVGWTLLCGPREGITHVVGFLRQLSATAPDNAAVLDIDVKTAVARRLFTRQLAELDEHAPPRATSGVEMVQRAMFEQARRTAGLITAFATDADSLHATVTQDENAMHLVMDMGIPHASSDQTRALIAASAGHQADTALLATMPAAVQSWIVGGFDRAQMAQVFGAPTLDPAIALQAGPEIARVMGSIDELKNLMPFGERVDAYSPADGFTMYHVIRRPDAAQFINDLRVAINSIPARPLNDGTGGTLRDAAAIMPTPGLTGTVLRVGRNVRIPPGVQVPPQIREMLARSMLLVAENDRLIAVMGRDPVASYRAMSQGPRLGASVPANTVFSGRITPPAFAPLFYGNPIPGLPESHTTDGVDFALTVERSGEGARVSLHADAPINAAMEVRQTFAMIQEAQAQMMQRLAQQQQQMQQMQQGGGGAGGGGGGGMVPGGGMMRPGPGPGGRPRPQLDPSMLPEPPPMRLQPPR